MNEYYFEVQNALKKSLRAVGAIVDDALFVIEEGSVNRWSGIKFSVFYCSVRNPYRERTYFTDRMRIGETRSILEAKQLIRNYAKNEAVKKKVSENKATAPIAQLPSGDNSDFYPTPLDLAGKMLSCVNWKKVKYILEPSAGKGDLLKAVQYMVEDRRYRDERSLAYDLKADVKTCVDVIESDYNLRMILRGMGYRLVDEDFLTYHTEKRYDLILMNPPFSNGASHLLHAIGLIEGGGQVVCLLNAETIRNPYTKERKLLQQVLADNNARIEFVQHAFTHAERKSDVEVAIVYVNVDRKRSSSAIFENAQKAVQFRRETEGDGQNSYLIVSDEIEALIQRYNVEAKAGVDFLIAYDNMVPYIMEGTDKYAKPLIQVAVDGSPCESVSNDMVNKYLERLRYKYWQAFLNRPTLRNRMTSQIANNYSDKIREMSKYEFNKHNIAQVLYDIQSQLVCGVEEAIVELFDKLSSKYCVENEKNVHYYNGWKTNKAHAVGMKAILPINGFSSYSWEKNKLDEYRVCGVLDDLEKTLHYLDKGEVGISYDVVERIRSANAAGKASATLSYFSVKFYKKGTAHITFHPETKPLIERLNIFAGQKKGWLPPSYGKKTYSCMDEAERAVVDEFQGKDAYDAVMANPGRYILEASSLTPMLTA